MDDLAKITTVIIFFLTWFLILPQKWSFLPLGRSMSALFGASLLMCFQIISVTQAFSFVNEGIQVLALLFGLMVLSNYCEKEGFFDTLEKALTYKCHKGWNLVLRVVIVSGVLSAFLTNDAVCIFLTPPLVRIAKHYKLDKTPLLIALGTSTNIGSAATLSGNPQNAYIGVQSGISYTQFMSKLAVVSIVGLFVNFGLLWIYDSKIMKAALTTEDDDKTAVLLPRTQDTLSNDEEMGTLKTERSYNDKKEQRMNFIMRIVLIIVLIGVLISFMLGFNLAVTSLVGALLIVFFEALLLRYEPKSIVEGVDFQLLIFFSGLFIVVGALTETGYPQMLWDSVFENVSLYSAGGIALFSAIVMVASNLISNVPAVVMATPLLLGLADSRLAWLLLAWVSTIAGNLTIIGSAAMIIVAERAFQTDSTCLLSSRKYLAFGVPSTLVVATLGVPLLCGLDQLY